MPDREKIRLMIRLSMFEERFGKRIRKAENTSRIDLVTNPVWRWGFVVTLLFFLAAGGLAALNIDMLLDAVSKDQTKNLIMMVLIAWLSTLVVTVVIRFVLSLASVHRTDALRQEYHQMLEQLERTGRMAGRQETGAGYGLMDEDLWEAAPEKGRGRRRREAEEDLDYRNMQVLEFEDDDYRYYVEAVPKRGGRRG